MRSECRWRLRKLWPPARRNHENYTRMPVRDGHDKASDYRQDLASQQILSRPAGQLSVTGHHLIAVKPPIRRRPLGTNLFHQIDKGLCLQFFHAGELQKAARVWTVRACSDEGHARATFREHRAD